MKTDTTPEGQVDQGGAVAGGLRAYMAYEATSGSEEGAVLVFARNGREARKLAFPVVSGWFSCDFTDLRVRWLRSGCAHMREADGPHVVECPPNCQTCERWFEEPLDGNGECEGCADEREDADAFARSILTPKNAVEETR